MHTVYNALKRRGFRETYWQVVYPGQIGGLIRNPRRGFLELHVRFYEDHRIYAELEVARWALAHFFMHRMFANEHLIAMLAHDLSPHDARYLSTAIEAYKAGSRKRWPEWKAGSRIMSGTAKRMFGTWLGLSDWRFLAFAMLLSFAAVWARTLVIVPILAALFILVYLVAPRRS